MERTNNLSKLLIKVYDSKADVWKWLHFCYIPEDLHTQYKAQREDDLNNLNQTLTRWCKEDFKKDVMVSTTESLDTLKGLIKDFYKETYPDVFLNQSTDRQGWLRVWVTKKMKEDLEVNGEQSI